jgi:hypothetical protein
MSCLIQDTKNIGYIANFIYELKTYGFNHFKFDCPRMVYYEFEKDSVEDIARKLMLENLKAYDSRYTKDNNKSCDDWYVGDAVKASKTADSLPFLEYKNGCSVVTPEYFQMLKHIQFLQYQICEDSTVNGDIYKCLTALINALSEFIISNMEVYKACKWS